ncbi:mycothiol acetyltransferase [Zafaria cholistanensis]|uniref:Mycothiol acetyltransferase n=1 Tax=Zafaria cholistanensis TaxID=1682741 RepID=A0A5A7NM21_9MICC|nr:mycothiol synthase [Zafaria cholistanensis]GER21556.1 mycothiol acetyltransferase [Zafaria cholistanensis]
MSAATSTDWTITLLPGAPDTELLRQVRALAAAAEESDGNPPLSEQTLVRLGAPRGAGSLLGAYAHLVEEGDGRGALVGVAVAALPLADEPGVLELVVHPEARHSGIGTALVEASRASTDVDRLQAWAHGGHDGAARLAQRYGFAPVRELWRMRLVHPVDLPEPALPEGLTLRAFVPGRDEDAWLEANRAAFAHHPEQGALGRADLEARMAEDWFDPDGFLLAVDAQDRIAGFHWTKIHQPELGEVYVVGVVPGAQGGGLGRALTVAGIRHLVGRGIRTVMLYVDADNEPAVRLYRSLGFTRWDVDTMYAHRGRTGGATGAQVE